MKNTTLCEIYLIRHVKSNLPLDYNGKDEKICW